MKKVIVAILLIICGNALFSQQKIEITNNGAYLIDKSFKLTFISEHSFVGYNSIGNILQFYGDGSEACIYVNTDSLRVYNLKCYCLETISKNDKKTIRVNGVILQDPKDWYEVPYSEVIIDPDFENINIEGNIKYIFTSIESDKRRGDRPYKKIESKVIQLDLFNKSVNLVLKNKILGNINLQLVFDQKNNNYFLFNSSF